MATLNTTWEIAQALGVGAVASCLVLCVLAVRPRAGAARGFSLRGHELLGWLALAAAVLHVGLLLVADRLVIEHLKPSAPRYEYAGVVSLFTLIFLTVAAGAAVRSRIWPRHRSFQAAHVGAACLLVVTLAIHVLTTDRYVHGRAHRFAYVLLSCVALLALLRERAQRPPALQPSRGFAGLVFGRHSRLMAGIVLGSIVAVLAMMQSGATRALREPLLMRGQRLVLYFPHEQHRAIACVYCHHNFTDRTGDDSCVSCHRSGRADLRVGAEARFHDFCLGCHRDPPAYLSGRGPETGCKTCHAPSTAAW